MGTDLSDLVSEGGEEMGARIDAAAEASSAAETEKARQERAERFAPPIPLRTWMDLPTLATRGEEAECLAPCRLWRGDEAELADIIIDHFLGDLAVFTGGSFYQYLPEPRRISDHEVEGPGWTPISEARIWNVITERMPGALVYKGRTKDGDIRMEALKVTSGRAKGVVEVLQRRLTPPGSRDFWRPVLPDHIESRPNGIVHFQDVAVVVWQEGPGVLRHQPFAPGPDLRIRSSEVLPCSLGELPHTADLARDCPLFLQVCREWWGHHGEEELQARTMAVLEFMGAAFLRMAPHMGKVLLMFGRKGTGKSTFMEVLLRWFGVQRGGGAQASVCSVTPQKMASNRFATARLDGALLNFVDDLGNETVEGAGEFKTAVTGHRLTAEVKYGSSYEFFPRAAHVIASNQMPPLRSPDEGFFDRWLIVEWDRVFRGTQVERAVGEEILAEMPRLVPHAVAAFIETGGKGGRGYTEPDCHHRSLASWRNSANSAAEFLDECCVYLPADLPTARWTRRPEVWEAYKAWCRGEADRKGFGRNKFYRKLVDLGVSEEKSGELRFNIRLNDIAVARARQQQF